MATATAQLTLPRVRLFRSGTYGEGTDAEETWTVRDLDAVVRNFWALCRGPHAIYRVPIVIGHINPDPEGHHTTVPAYGAVDGLWREGRHLYGAFAELDPDVRSWMDSGALRSVSVELYRDPREADIPPELANGASGPMLRRVSLLGGHPPRSKGLGNPPWAAGERADVGGRYATKPGRIFAELEAPRMDRDHLMQVAQQAGHGQQFLDTLDDSQLAGLVADMAGRMLGGGTPAGGPGNADTSEPDLDDRTDLQGDNLEDVGGGGETAQDSAAPAGRDQMIQELVGMGEDEQALEQMDDQSLQELYLQRKGGSGAPEAPTQMGERTVPKPKLAVPVQLSARTIKQYAQAAARSAFAEIDKPNRERRLSEFCERMVREGKLTPAQVDRKDGPTWKLLVAARSIAAFGEQSSQLELLMAEIEARPAVRSSGERLKQGPGGVVGGGGLSPERRAAILGGSAEGRALLRDQQRKGVS